ncbi:MAG: four helix bundle protein [Cyanobacteria bacterium 13_1_40CM_2_61_4]|nr:MAG: four helix bundle protein [Cyanobacteria bacterium 13_1_40CM_2_61_4]
MSRSPSRTFQDLIVWRKAHEFVLTVYRESASFPRTEIFGLTSQLRRAAVSVPANIAEGFVKRGKPDKARLMNIAQGSLEEARYYLILADDLGYLDNATLLDHIEEISRLLERYIACIRFN